MILDIDECADLDVKCPNCLNVPGSYYCHHQIMPSTEGKQEEWRLEKVPTSRAKSNRGALPKTEDHTRGEFQNLTFFIRSPSSRP
jgi:hypothetical protein